MMYIGNNGTAVWDHLNINEWIKFARYVVAQLLLVLFVK